MSWLPVRMTFSARLIVVRVLARKRAVQSALHRVPMLRRLWASLGTTWPCRVSGERAGRLRDTVLVDRKGWPVAMQMIVWGAVILTFRSGALR